MVPKFERSATLPPEHNEIDLKHLINIIRRTLPRIITITIIVAIVAVIVSVKLPPIYRATAVLKLQTEQALPVSIKGVLEHNINSKNYFQTQIEILRSDLITGKVIHQLELMQHPYYTQPPQPSLLFQTAAWLPEWGLLQQFKQATTLPVKPKLSLQPFTRQIKAAVSINPIKNTQLINISYEHRQPELAAEIANAYVQAYIQHIRDFRIQQTINASSWLEDGVLILKDNLNQAEQALADFLQQENLNYDSEVAHLTSNELNNLTHKLNQIRAALLTQSFKKNLALIKQNEQAVLTELEQKKAEYRSIIRQKTRYKALSREVASSSELYNMFLMRLKETNLTNELNPSTANQTSIAKPPLETFKPKRTLILLFVILLALIGLVLHALFRSFWLVNQDNISQLQPQLLGSIPNLKAADKQFRQLSPQQLFQANNMIREAAQSLATTLQLSMPTHKQQIIVLTSAGVAEGKSTVAMFLAMALAQNSKALLIEADLRKPSIAKKMGIPTTRAGLTDILRNGGRLSDSIWYDSVSQLAVMPAKEVKDNPLNLLNSKRFQSCLTIFKSQYDYIVIDSPPSQLVSDTFIIAQAADINILVTRANVSKRHELDDTIAELSKHSINVNGIILNNVALQDDKKYHYQYQRKAA